MLNFLFKVLGLTDFINWLKSSFDDNAGKVSFHRIAPFILNGTCVYVMVTDKIPKEDVRYAFTAMLIAGAFYAGLITFQNVFQLFQTWRGINTNTTTTDTIQKTNTTETVIADATNQ